MEFSTSRSSLLLQAYFILLCAININAQVTTTTPLTTTQDWWGMSTADTRAETPSPYHPKNVLHETLSSLAPFGGASGMPGSASGIPEVNGISPQQVQQISPISPNLTTFANAPTAVNGITINGSNVQPFTNPGMNNMAPSLSTIGSLASGMPIGEGMTTPSTINGFSTAVVNLTADPKTATTVPSIGGNPTTSKLNTSATTLPPKPNGSSYFSTPNFLLTLFMFYSSLLFLSIIVS